MIFAAIADDYTGASDLAGMLAQEGVRTVQLLGLPEEEAMQRLGDRFDAAVISLKSRSVPSDEACRLSLEALSRLRLLQPSQIQFKYCSTFDSTKEGNIGPVTAALMEQLGTDFTIAVPALPVNGRSQYFGYLFVGNELLSDSPMRHHPLNPMNEPSLVRHLQAQTPKKVGLIPWPAVHRGKQTVLSETERLKAEGIEIALVDALEDRDLAVIAEAFVDFPLVTGGSGITSKLPDVWKKRELLAGRETVRPKLNATQPGVLILSGSCSQATLEQLARFENSGRPAFALDIEKLLAGVESEVHRLHQRAAAAIRENSVAVVFSSAPPAAREKTLDEAEAAGLRRDDVRLRIEQFFAQLARRMVEGEGIRRLVVAGGETSGAAVEALGVTAVEILEVLDPGVPCLLSLGQPEMALALKSGNFGSPDFFCKAAEYMEAL